MQKLFESWRGYINEVFPDEDPNPLPPRPPRVVNPIGKFHKLDESDQEERKMIVREEVQKIFLASPPMDAIARKIGRSPHNAGDMREQISRMSQEITSPARPVYINAHNKLKEQYPREVWPMTTNALGVERPADETYWYIREVTKAISEELTELYDLLATNYTIYLDKIEPTSTEITAEPNAKRYIGLIESARIKILYARQLIFGLQPPEQAIEPVAAGAYLGKWYKSGLGWYKALIFLRKTHGVVVRVKSGPATQMGGRPVPPPPTVPSEEYVSIFDPMWFDMSTKALANHIAEHLEEAKEEIYQALLPILKNMVYTIAQLIPYIPADYRAMLAAVIYDKLEQVSRHIVEYISDPSNIELLLRFIRVIKEDVEGAIEEFILEITKLHTSRPSSPLMKLLRTELMRSIAPEGSSKEDMERALELTKQFGPVDESKKSIHKINILIG